MGAKQRLRKWLEQEKIGLREFSRKAGLSVGFIGSGENIGSDNLDKIRKIYPEIDLYWIITGELKISDLETTSVQYNEQKLIPSINTKAHDSLNRETELKKFKLRTDRVIRDQSVPLYDIEATAGLVPLFEAATDINPIDHIIIPNLPKCDGAIHIKGDSMYPLLKSGDIVLYKEIQDIENDLFYGEMYLVSIDVGSEEYVTVKFVQKDDKDGYVKLVSQNQHHEPKSIKISKIRALALVKASIRINSMN
ncbi:S24 family peptidase [Aquimarina longa]|uniref:S24 family peptidase n=1 Tax=Aquimarina longa TaxID=1080221 RepID=UPI00078087B7|nr:S24 family peptidase [Aquimarina longa]